MKALNPGAESADEFSWRASIRPASAAVLRYQAASAAIIFRARDQCLSTLAVHHPSIRHHDKASAPGGIRASTPICQRIRQTEQGGFRRMDKTHPADSGMLRSRPKRFTITGAMFRLGLGS
jgi:hypothetical protein